MIPIKDSSCRIWTRVNVSIFSDDNHYITSQFNK